VTEAVLEACDLRPAIKSPMSKDDPLAGFGSAVTVVLSTGRGEPVELGAAGASLTTTTVSSFSTSFPGPHEPPGVGTRPLSNQETTFVGFVADVLSLAASLGVVTLRNGVSICTLAGVLFLGVSPTVVLIDLVGDDLGLFLASGVATRRSGEPNGGLEGDCGVQSFFSKHFVLSGVVAFRTGVPNTARVGVDFLRVPARTPPASTFRTGDLRTAVLNSALAGVSFFGVLSPFISLFCSSSSFRTGVPPLPFFGLILLIGNSQEK
jgi:hypothetical protein